MDGLVRRVFEKAADPGSLELLRRCLEKMGSEVSQTYIAEEGSSMQEKEAGAPSSGCVAAGVILPAQFGGPGTAAGSAAEELW